MTADSFLTAVPAVAYVAHEAAGPFAPVHVHVHDMYNVLDIAIVPPVLSKNHTNSPTDTRFSTVASCNLQTYCQKYVV